MKRWKTVFILLIQTLLLSALTLLCVVPFSCRVSEEGIILLGGDYEAPLLEEVNVLDERTVKISFSEKIKMKSYVVSEQIKGLSDSYEHSQTKELSPALKAAGGAYGKVESDYSVSEDGCIISFCAGDKYEVGKAYEIFGVVEDKAGNTLTFCVPFSGYNSRIPKLVLTEIQPRYKKYKEEYRCEFVEILALTEGNLSGLEIFSAADGDAKKFQLPPLEVKAGEVFVVHLRDGKSGAVTEEENLNESKAAHSAKNVRDIWSSNDKSRLGESNDVILIRNTVNTSILDGLMYALEDAVEWPKSMDQFAEELVAAGIYDSSDISDVEKNSGLGSSAQNSFTRTDALVLQQLALAGSFAGDEVDYPVHRNEESWVVKKAGPGSL